MALGFSFAKSLLRACGFVGTIEAARQCTEDINGAINDALGSGLLADAPLTKVDGHLAIPSATNARNGYATSAQIGKLEGLQAGIADVETLTATGTLSVTKGVSLVAPAADSTLTLANGTAGQRKLIVLSGGGHSVHITGTGLDWTGGTAGDRLDLVFAGGTWVTISSYVD